MEYVLPAQYAAAGAAEGGDAGEGIDIVGWSSSTAAPAEQQVLALSGLCPVSLAGSVAAAGAWSGQAGEGEGGSDAAAAGAGEKLLVGRFARPEHGLIR